MSKHRIHFNLHITRWIIVGLVLTGKPRGLEKACAKPEEAAQRIESAIDEVQAEWQAESQRIEQEKQARHEQLDALRAESLEMADELVERKLAIARKQQALAELRRQREALWAEQTQWQEELTEIAAISGDVQAELSQIAETSPVSESRSKQKEMLSELIQTRAEGTPQEMVGLTVDLIDSFLREARTSAIYDSEITDPRGQRRMARLLRVGRNLFAYHIPETSQAAIAISAPHELTGFRWQDQLPKHVRESLLEGIEEASGPVAFDPTWLPIDVTGQIAATADFQPKGLWSRLRSGGVVMFPLAIVALCLALLVIDRFLVLLREGRHSLRFCDHVLRLCSQGEFEEAQRMAEGKKGVLSRTLRTCLAHRHSPPAILDDAIQETLLHEFPKLERFLPSIRMLSAVAPMLGLLGTVTGIITTFDVIAVVGSGQPRLMAGGISEALITTATGLAIAIPGLLAHSVLSGKVDGIIADTERFAATVSNLVRQNQHKTRDGQDKTHGTSD